VSSYAATKSGSEVRSYDVTYATVTEGSNVFTRNLISSVINPTDNTDRITYGYDGSGRLTGISTPTVSDGYSYDGLNRLKSYTISGSARNYDYDDKNNLIGEYSQNRYGERYVINTYEYNSNGQLISMSNTKYFRYDALGNMTMYKGDTATSADNMTWCEGNKLRGGNFGGRSVTYDYDPNGMRYKKNINGVETEYYLDGGRIAAEYRKGENVFIYYYYDATGIAGMNYGGTDYYFKKNILGDILKIYNATGVEVGSYRYDPWGKIETISGEMAEKNAFRYRGYYYDTETGFYYLQTRYYDPSIRRFISADNYELIPTLAQTLGQLNMYAYCNNNPIMYTDETGEGIGIILLGLLFCGIINGVLSVGNMAEGETAWGAFAGGFVNGVLSSIGLAVGVANGGWLIPLVLGFAGGFFGNALTQKISYGDVNWNIAAISGITNGLANVGMGVIWNQTGLIDGKTFGARVGQMVMPSMISIGLSVYFANYVIPNFNNMRKTEKNEKDITRYYVVGI